MPENAKSNQGGNALSVWWNFMQIEMIKIIFQCSAPFRFEICKIRNAKRSIMLDGKPLNSIGQIPFVKRAPLGFCDPFIGFCQIRITIDRARAWRRSLLQEILRKSGLIFQFCGPSCPEMCNYGGDSKTIICIFDCRFKERFKGQFTKFSRYFGPSTDCTRHSDAFPPTKRNTTMFFKTLISPAGRRPP